MANVSERHAVPFSIPRVINFIPEFPGAWELERVHDYTEDRSDDSDSDADNEEGDSEPPKVFSPRSSAAYSDFLQFLELGCAGAPVQGYPTVIIILSTIPSSVRAVGCLFRSC